MMIAAHPTIYKGTRFRSRLEARWAAFFDRVAWSWQYEVIDLRGWVPDFYLPRDPAIAHTRAAMPIFLEVKPALTYAALTLHRERIDTAAPRAIVYLVGAVLPFAGPALGQARSPACAAWGVGTLAWCRGPCGGRLTLAAPQSPTITLCVFCGHRVTLGDAALASRVARTWVLAGNDTRWTP